ncbi:MAG: cell division protein FtsZ [Thermoplasmata archaeon]|jgi:cell division protein FtsZ|nr:cell division protein FtsZ [Thermoplasmatales archaeon]
MKSLVENALKGIQQPGKDQVKSEEAAKIVSPDEEELKRIVEQMKVNIRIVGCGGGGSNTVTRIMREGIVGADLIAVNTDAPHLLQVLANRKILLGERLTRGLGAGADPRIGEEAAREADEKLRNVLQRSHIVFITAGMGGGTGTGAAPYIAQVAKEVNPGCLVIGVVTLPFSAEGKVRMEQALYGLDRLKKYCDTTIVIPNDKLLAIVPRLPLDQAFKVADEVLMEALKGLTEIITKPGLVNIDYADIKSVMANGGVAMIGIGESGSSGDRVTEAVNEAINSPLIEADIKQARGALVRIVGDTKMSVMEAQKAADIIQKQISPNAKLIWGASIDPELDNGVKVLIVVTGVKSPYILDEKASVSEMKKAAHISSLDSSIDSL